MVIYFSRFVFNDLKLYYDFSFELFLYISLNFNVLISIIIEDKYSSNLSIIFESSAGVLGCLR